MAWLPKLFNRQATSNRPQPYIPKGTKATGLPSLGISQELQDSYKSLSYSNYVSDFVNGADASTQYSEQQIQSAYKTSVYLFAVTRKVANLASELKLVGEYKKDGKWARLPETHPLNIMMTSLGTKFLFDVCMYYLLYGKVVVYKRKTAKGVYAYDRDKETKLTYPHMVGGLHVIPNSHLELQGDEWSGDNATFPRTP